MRRPWDGIVPAEEQETYKLAGMGTASKFGSKPALLIIDVQYRTIGTRPQPIRQAIAEFPTSCGEIGWEAVRHMERILRCFREKKLPVIYPHIAPKAAYDRTAFSDRVPGVMKIPSHGYKFVEEVSPQEGEVLIPKYHASAFFGTQLTSYLVALGVDSLVFTGCTTSGCVRASVVDACSLNYKAIVCQDAVFDRSSVSHAVNLFDIAHKYADVMPTDDAIAVVESMRRP